VKAWVELRVPFELERQAIDDVDRGANDSDWQPAKDGARKIAFAEDGAVFEGYTAAGIAGIRKGISNPPLRLPANVREYPEAIAQALSRLRLVGVNGPYSEDRCGLGLAHEGEEVVMFSAAVSTRLDQRDQWHPVKPKFSELNARASEGYCFSLLLGLRIVARD
jgi:hypothetical protein